MLPSGLLKYSYSGLKGKSPAVADCITDTLVAKPGVTELRGVKGTCGENVAAVLEVV